MCRPFATVLLIVLLVSFCAGALAAAESGSYFYLNVCASCKPEEQFAEDFQRLTGRKLSDYWISFHNVYTASGRAAYEEATLGWDEEDRQLPLLILGGKAYTGYASIAEGVGKSIGVPAQGTDSLVVFLTATTCAQCERAREAVDALPAVVAVEHNGKLQSSHVKVQQISISSEPGLALAYFEHYQLPDELRVVPAVFFGDSYLVGTDAIRRELRSAVSAGRALNTPSLDTGEKPLPAIALWGAFVAGLVAGFNPCALSMLLVFVGALLSLRRRLFLYGCAYLSGKLAVYLLVGLVFAQAWMQHAPGWLPLAMRIVVTVIGAITILLNVMDMRHARREEYGQIRNQLPTALRGRIRSLIQRSIGRAGYFLAPVALATGIIVGFGEFLCAGQLYVAVLIANAGTGAAMPLLLYSVAFLLPSFALVTLLSIGRTTGAVSDWMLRHLPAIKLVTVVMMAAVIAYTWLVN